MKATAEAPVAAAVNVRSPVHNSRTVYANFVKKQSTARIKARKSKAPDQPRRLAAFDSGVLRGRYLAFIGG